MKLLSNIHTHSTFCDGANTPREMAEAALGLGFTDLGFSSHAPAPFDPTCSGIADEAAYRREIEGLKAEYAGRLGILCGVESDTLAPVDARQYDYVICSNHYLPPQGGRYYAVDEGAGQLAEAIDKQYCGDALAMAEAYYALQLQGVKAQRPAVVGHFDLLKKYNGDGLFYKVDDARYRQMARRALEEVVTFLAPYGGMLEVNTGAMARGLCPEPYPGLDLLRHAAKLGARVIVTSDSHSAATLDACFAEALEMVRQAGFSQVMVLRQGTFQPQKL